MMNALSQSGGTADYSIYPKFRCGFAAAQRVRVRLTRRRSQLPDRLAPPGAQEAPTVLADAADRGGIRRPVRARHCGPAGRAGGGRGGRARQPPLQPLPCLSRACPPPPQMRPRRAAQRPDPRRAVLRRWTSSASATACARWSRKRAGTSCTIRTRCARTTWRWRCLPASWRSSTTRTTCSSSSTCATSSKRCAALHSTYAPVHAHAHA